MYISLTREKGQPGSGNLLDDGIGSQAQIEAVIVSQEGQQFGEHFAIVDHIGIQLHVRIKLEIFPFVGGTEQFDFLL